MSLTAVRIKTGREYSIYALEENERCKLLDFFQTLSSIEKKRLNRRLDWVKDNAQTHNTEVFKPIGDGFLEIRTQGGVRVFCFFDAGKVVICTNGYVKKKDRLDPGEIDRARIWRQKYFVAKSEDSLKFVEGEI